MNNLAWRDSLQELIPMKSLADPAPHNSSSKLLSLNNDGCNGSISIGNRGFTTRAGTPLAVRCALEEWIQF